MYSYQGTNDVTKVQYYRERWLRLEETFNRFENEYKDIAREIGVDTGDFDDVKYNKNRRKNPYYKKNINSIAASSAKLLASLLTSHLTNPQQRWFYLSVDDKDDDLLRDESIWLRKCEDIMYRKFARSKLHQALHNVYHEGELFGTGVMARKETKDGVVYKPMTIGQYFIDQDENGNVTTLARKYAWTLEQAANTFGVESLPQHYQNLFNQGNRSELIEIRHFVEPNLNYLPNWDNPYNKPFLSTYYVDEQNNKESILEQKGMDKFPFYVLRWDRYGTQVYGSGIGRFVLGDVRMLQSNESDLAKASKKKVSPPLKGPTEMKNQAAKVGSDQITYTDSPEGYTALYNVNYDTRQAMENIQRCERRIEGAFFIDIFLALMSDQRTKSATEANAIDQEKFVVLGAVTDRIRTEFLDKIVEDEFENSLRAGEFPEPPESLQGRELSIGYQSVLLQSMEMTDLIGLERYLQFTVQQAGVDPIAAMIPDTLKVNENYAKKLGINRENMRPMEEVRRMYEQQIADMEAQRQETGSKTALNQAKAAKELSDTNTTAENALTDLVG